MDETWLDLALRAADMGAISWDIKGDRLYVSERAAAILGATPGEMPARGGEQVFAFTHPDDMERVREAILGAARTGEPYKIEHRSFRVGDGAVIWILSAGTPVRGKNGKVTRILGVVQDITTRKTAEAQRETLVAELDHRVKNVLASVQSMAMQSARKAPSLQVFMKTFAGRLKAMASAHALLTAARWRGADVQHIVAAELGGLSPAQTRWEGPEVVLTPRATNALALALHELATNAVKFGALSVEAGRVDVRWRIGPEGGLDLNWVESGGPPVATPTRQGFGSTLLSRVTGRELGGSARVEFAGPGVRAHFTSSADVILSTRPSLGQALANREAVPAPPAPEERDPTLAARIAGLKVLIVEDSLLLSLELENGLVEAGATVIGQATNVAEALALAGPGIDAAVLDANLNGESVVPVAEALRRLNVPFVFATGYGDNALAPTGFDAPIVRKPYNVSQVAAALAEATGRA